MSFELSAGYPGEVWIPVPEYPYTISSHGRIKNSKGVLLKVFTYTNGYCGIFLCKNSTTKQFRFHRLVLLCFEGPSSLQVRHLDGNKQNNRLDNLQYGTHAENEMDKRTHGTVTPKGEENCTAKVTQDQVEWLVDFYRTHLLARKACGYKKIKHGLKGKIAQEVGLTTSGVSNILKGSAWGWLKNAIVK